MLKSQPLRAIGMRMGYSLVCWVIGIAAYAGGVAYLATSQVRADAPNAMYNFYVLIALPIVIAAGVTAVVVRPFYLVMVSKLYTDVVPIDASATELAVGKKVDALALFFAILLGVLLALYFFGDELGVRAWIESLAAKDVQEYKRSR